MVNVNGTLVKRLDTSNDNIRLSVLADARIHRTKSKMIQSSGQCFTHAIVYCLRCRHDWREWTIGLVNFGRPQIRAGMALAGRASGYSSSEMNLPLFIRYE
jgi:hypothetical protein